jgi:hypothetical protein
VPQGELIELLPSTPVRYMSGDAEFQTNPDGSELISFFGEEDQGGNAFDSFDTDAGGFGENLAELMSGSQRHQLADKLIEFHRVDLESRSGWEERARQGLRLLGIEKADVSSLPFAGAAAMQHPVIAEACVQFNANAIEEFFPATGPVKGDLAGEATPESEEQVERASDFMNYYLVTEDEGYYADKDQSLFYLPIAGSMFVKAWTDPRDRMPKARYIKADDFVAPYFARDLENCNRYCHQYQMSGSEIRRSMATGEFMELKLPRPPMDAETEGQRAIEDKADSRTRVLHMDDEVYEILEYHVEMPLPGNVDEHDDGTLDLPYIVVVDKTSREVLAVRRNWKEKDQRKRKRIWFAHYKFLPGLGFYGWGFLHVIGSLADAISGTVRAALDSALFATLQGGFRAKDGVKKAGSLTIEPGKWKEIDCTYEELAKTFYTPPAKETPAALVQLLTALVQDARRFTSLTEVLVGQADNKAPVGTTIALIEQSMKMFTAIHKRIFAAARQEFRMLAELLHDFGPDEYPYYLKGEQRTAFKEDFDDRVDFIPVADPNIVSDVQRMAKAQAVLELTMASPELYGPEQRVEAHKRFLQALKVPNWEAIAPKLPTATYLDPVGENGMMMIGRPVRAYPGQDHDAHMLVVDFGIQVAMNTLPPDQFEPVYAAMMAHKREHMALKMGEQVNAMLQQQVGAPLPPVDLFGENVDQDPALERAVSLLASRMLPPPPPPAPGSVAAASAEGAAAKPDPVAEAQRKTEAEEVKTIAAIERDTTKFAADSRRKAADHSQAIRFREEEHDQAMRHADEQAAADLLRARADAQVTRLQDARTADQRRRHEQVAGASKLALEVKRAREVEKAKKAAAAKKKSGNGSMKKAA